MKQEFVQVMRRTLGRSEASLHEPEFLGNEHKYVTDCLNTTFVSGNGAYVSCFAEAIGKFCGVKHVVPVSCGTAALQIALIVAGVKPGEEVLVPALTFVATANAVKHCNATPHFVDVELETFGVDVSALRKFLVVNTISKGGVCVNKKTGQIIRAIVPVHIFGHPCKIIDLLKLASEFNIQVVEDAAEGLGSLYKGQHVGTFGQMGVLSFNGNKIITTGNGGAILTNNEDFAKRANHITNTAKLPHAFEYFHDEVGYNYRLSNLNAALGCAQLESLEEKICQKRELFHIYRRAFKSFDCFELVGEPKNARSNFWLNTIMLKDANLKQRNEFLSFVNSNGFLCRPAWSLNNKLPPFINCPSMPTPVAEDLVKKLINIPSSNFLCQKQ